MTQAKRRCSMRRLLFTFLLVELSQAFSTLSRHSVKPTTRTVLHAKLLNHNPLLATALIGLVLASPLPTQAYDPSDYASETVTEAVKSLKDAAGDSETTFKVYEGIAAIITEGKGVGGSINYKGVQLDRGYIADEDTAIYNPGLSLLTESEKERLVEAVIDSRKAGLSKNSWSENNQLAYEFLKDKLDPLHVVELKGYLGVIPIFGAVLYLAVLAVQQLARELFPTAYIAAAVAIFAPIALLVALGPQ